MVLNAFQKANFRKHTHYSDQVIDPDTGEPAVGGGGAISVEEDGDTAIEDVTNIVFVGATVTDDGDGQVTVEVTTPYHEFSTSADVNYAITSGTFVDIDSVGSDPDFRLAFTSTRSSLMVKVSIIEWGGALGIVACLDIALDGTRAGGDSGLTNSGPEVSSGNRRLDALYHFEGVTPGAHTIVPMAKTSGNTANFTSDPLNVGAPQLIYIRVWEL